MKIYKNDCLITQSNLSDYRYNPITCKVYKRSGKLMMSKSTSGSPTICIRGKSIYQNRIVCFLCCVPFTSTCHIKHLDGDVTNLAIDNLKVVSRPDILHSESYKGTFKAKNDKYLELFAEKYTYNPNTGEIHGLKGVVKPCRNKGYVHLNTLVDGKNVRLNGHRLACYLLGHDIDGMEIDHLDGNRGNNRADNLRIVDRSTNRRNAALVKRNTSGITGVSWHKNQNRWEVKCLKKTVGYSRDFFEACCLRKSYENKVGRFTDRNGVVAAQF